MVTVVRVNLTDEQRRTLHVALTGRAGLATRQQIEGWALRTLGKSLEGKPEGGGRMVTIVCPKCGRPFGWRES